MRIIVVIGVLGAVGAASASHAKKAETPTYSKTEIDRKLEQLRDDVSQKDPIWQDMERRLSDLQDQFQQQQARIEKQAQVIAAQRPSSDWVAPATAALSIIAIGFAALSMFRRRSPRKSKPEPVQEPIDLSVDDVRKVAVAIGLLEHLPLNGWETESIVETGNWLSRLARSVDGQAKELADPELEAQAIAFWQGLSAAASVPVLAAHMEAWRPSLGRFVIERSGGHESGIRELIGSTPAFDERGYLS